MGFGDHRCRIIQSQLSGGMAHDGVHVEEAALGAQRWELVFARHVHLEPPPLVTDTDRAATPANRRDDGWVRGDLRCCLERPIYFLAE